MTCRWSLRIVVLTIAILSASHIHLFAQGGTAPAYETGVIPPELPPNIPPGDDIILYIHGGPGSRLEEAADIANPLLAAGIAQKKRYTVISFDQPSQGYSSMHDPEESSWCFSIPPLNTPIPRKNPSQAPSQPNQAGQRICGYPLFPDHDEIGDYYPLVATSEEFIIAFVNALDKIVPIKNRNIYIIGGSTGGALSLRMGHRSDLPWVKKIVAWNPASVWTTFSHDVAKGAATNTSFGWSTEFESASTRAEHFNNVYGMPPTHGLGVQPNPEEWYRGDRDQYPSDADTHTPFRTEWECKWGYIEDSRLENEEIYNSANRRWHWRLGTEELLFSFFNDSWTGPANTASSILAANYAGIVKPTMLVAADDDDWNEGYIPGPQATVGATVYFHWENRWTQTGNMAKLMANTPGYTLYLPNTGHSIHNERPNFFAKQIINFFSNPGSNSGPLQVNSLLDETQIPPEGGWAGEEPLGDSARQISVVRNADGRLEIVYVRLGSSIYHNWQTSAGGGWSGEAPLGGSAQQISVAANKDGRLEVFYVGTDNNIYHNWQTSAGGAWSGESAVGGSAKQISVGMNADGRLEIFYVGTDNNLYHNWQTSAGGAWSGEAPLGGSAQQISVAANKDGRLEVFYVGTDSRIYHNWQASGGGWSGESALGGSAQQISAGMNSDGRLEIFYVAPDSIIYHNWQITAGGNWAGESDLGGSAKQISVGMNADGRLEIFYVRLDNKVYRNRQISPGGNWYGENALGGQAKQIIAGVNKDGRLEIFYVGTDSSIYHNWQNTASGGCQAPFAQLQPIPAQLLDNPDSATYLMEPARLGGNLARAGGGASAQLVGVPPGSYSLRLRKELRAIFSNQGGPGGPLAMLASAAIAYYNGGPDHGEPCVSVLETGTPSQSGSDGASVPAGCIWGNAFADLAVSGRGNYDSFRAQPPTSNDVLDKAQNGPQCSSTSCTAWQTLSQPDPTKLNNAAQAALSRAYSVAWALRNPNPDVAYRFRPQLGWIAVSGEDDSPARPVNVPSGIPVLGSLPTLTSLGTQVSAYPQYELGINMCPPSPNGTPQFHLVDCNSSNYLSLSPSNIGVQFRIRYSVAGLPEINSINPASVPVGVPSVVTITGANFVGIQSVSSVTNFQFTIISPTQIAVSVPGNLAIGTYPVQVTTGVGYMSSTFNLTVRPVITSVSPKSGAYVGGSVTVTGGGFAEAGSALKFAVDGDPVSTTLALNGNSLCLTNVTCSLQLPPHKPGIADLTVCVGSICSEPTPADQFTFEAPIVTSISPSSGPATGGTSVNIFGMVPDSGNVLHIFFGGIEAQKGPCGPYSNASAPPALPIFACIGATSPPAAVPLQLPQESYTPVHVTAQAFGIPSNLSNDDLFTYELHAKLVSVSCDSDSRACRVQLNGFGPAVVLLTSSDPRAVTIPSLVNVSAGSTSVTFPINFPATSSTEFVKITAYPTKQIRGSTIIDSSENSASTSVLAYASGPIRATISLGASVLGPNESTTGKVTLITPTPPGNAVVLLLSSDPAAVAVAPSQITIPAGESSATFSVVNSYSGPPKKVGVTATYDGGADTAWLAVPEAILNCIPNQCPTGSHRNPGSCECVNGAVPQVR